MNKTMQLHLLIIVIIHLWKQVKEPTDLKKKKNKYKLSLKKKKISPVLES